MSSLIKLKIVAVFITLKLQISEGGLLRLSYLKVSSISVMLVSFSTTKKLGFRFLFSSPMPPSRKPVHVSSSPITAINFPRPAMVRGENLTFEVETEKKFSFSSTDHMTVSWPTLPAQCHERAPCCSEEKLRYICIW